MNDTLNELDYAVMVKEMKNPADYTKYLKNPKTNLLKKCIISKKHLTAAQWGPLLEASIIKTLDLSKIEATLNQGDAVSTTGKKIEIKVSLGATSGEFSFVQIRPNHDIDYYLFLAYVLDDPESILGKVYWFLIPSDKLYEAVRTHGGYAHGTVSSQGQIKEMKKLDTRYEYSFRANPKCRSGSQGNIKWEMLKNLTLFNTCEDIKDFLNKSYKPVIKKSPLKTNLKKTSPKNKTRVTKKISPNIKLGKSKNKKF